MYPIHEILVLLIIFSVIAIIMGKMYHRRLWNPLTFLVTIHFMGNWVLSLFYELNMVEMPRHFDTSGHYYMLQFNLFALIAMVPGYFIGCRLMKRRLEDLEERIGCTLYDTKYLAPGILELFYILLTIYMFGIGFILGGVGPRGQGQTLEGLYVSHYMTVFLLVRSPLFVIAFAIRILIKDIRWKRVIAALTIEMVIAFLSGDRDQIGFLVFGMIIVYFLLAEKTIRDTVYVSIGIAGMVIMNSIITITRDLLGSGYTTSSERLKMGLEGIGGVLKPVIEAISAISTESVQAWVANLWLAPGSSEHLMYGKTYVQGLVNMVIPRGFQGPIVSWQAAIVFKTAAYRNITGQGYDFTSSGEAVINFGMWGALMFIFVGISVGYIGYRYYRTRSIGYAITSVILLLFLTRSVRNDSTAFFRMLSLTLGTYWILTKIFAFKVYRITNLEQGKRFTGEEEYTSDEQYLTDEVGGDMDFL